jgi:hypothetical protein
VKKPYHIVTRAAKESAAVSSSSDQANGHILLPLVNLIESASQVVENVNSRNPDANSGDHPDAER